MSTRQAWIIDGYHFTKTTTERGGTRHFIDGMPCRRDYWHERMTVARMNETANTRAILAEQGIASSIYD